jgi:hypothetical protein
MPHCGKERKKNLWMMVRTWTDRNPIREPLGASGLKEREWERLERNHRSPQKKKRQYADRLLGTGSLKEVAM